MRALREGRDADVRALRDVIAQKDAELRSLRARLVSSEDSISGLGEAATRQVISLSLRCRFLAIRCPFSCPESHSRKKRF